MRTTHIHRRGLAASVSLVGMLLASSGMAVLATTSVANADPGTSQGQGNAGGNGGNGNGNAGDNSSLRIP